MFTELLPGCCHADAMFTAQTVSGSPFLKLHVQNMTLAANSTATLKDTLMPRAVIRFSVRFYHFPRLIYAP